MRIAAYGGLGALGLLVGVAGALVQAGWFPWGLLLALAAAGGLFWGAALATRSRMGAAAAAGGWAVAVLLLTITRPQGDFVFAADAGSYLFLLGGMAIAVVCSTVAPSERPLFAVPEPRPRPGARS
ncbi:DUF6113 family protein [Streptomyces specialis]|uniref:DUF6113 family protein n=1 Tax=Streptomyces specialis TaxID=498367 RepID=UPI00073E1670|nr:DUF6113 family protein [Streptomyces specialis]